MRGQQRYCCRRAMPDESSGQDAGEHDLDEGLQRAWGLLDTGPQNGSLIGVDEKCSQILSLQVLAIGALLLSICDSGRNLFAPEAQYAEELLAHHRRIVRRLSHE